MALVTERAYGGAENRPRWMADEESNTCFGCNMVFDSVNRRHHCRRCGMLYCAECSQYKSLIHPAEVVYPPDWDSVMSSFDPREPLRVCRGCEEDLEPQQAELLKTTAHAAQRVEVDREAIERYLNVPIQFEMASEIAKATNTLYNFCEDNAIEGSDSVPRELIEGAWGLAFVTTMQAGFFFSARMGSGLVIGRTPDGGWSAPSAVCTAGAGWGLQIGGEVTDMLIVLNSQDAVDAFASTAQLTLGTELSLALGPMGRSAETNMTAGDNGVSAVFSYAHSKGFFVGIALHACMILARPDCNERFYGKRYDVSQVLSGAVDRPAAADALYKALDEVARDLKPTQTHPHMRDLDVDKIKIRHVVDAAPPSVDSLPAVRAAPLSTREQEQIDADLALAIALSEEEAHAAAQANYAATQNDSWSAPPRPAPADSFWSGSSAPPTTTTSSSDSYSSWLGLTTTSAPPPSRRSDDWDQERRSRLMSYEDDVMLHGAEELKPMKGSAPRPTDEAYPDEEEVTL